MFQLFAPFFINEKVIFLLLLKMANVPFSEDLIEALVEKLDDDGDGEIDFRYGMVDEQYVYIVYSFFILIRVDWRTSKRN